jgi:hypothetical protein
LSLADSLFVVRENSPLSVAAKPYITQILGDQFINSTGWAVQSKMYTYFLFIVMSTDRSRLCLQTNALAGTHGQAGVPTVDRTARREGRRGLTLSASHAYAPLISILV